MLNDIDRHIQIIDDTLAWATRYGKESFPAKDFREKRRKLKKIRKAMEGNTSAAAYGESQVGKSYLMNALLSSPDVPFEIESGGRRYSFIDDLNSSGGNNSKVETTGVITRFTLTDAGAPGGNLVKVVNLSVTDIVLMLADSYYNDLRLDNASALGTDVINRELDALNAMWRNAEPVQKVLDPDDIAEMYDYLNEVIGAPAKDVVRSKFRETVSSFISSVPSDKWYMVFSLLWNRNEHITHLFQTLIDAYRRLDFNTVVYVPFDAVMRRKGTLLKISWLDRVCGAAYEPEAGEEPTTEVFDASGRMLDGAMPKHELSALIAEITFVVPASLAEQRPFMRCMDLLDFPGARSREKFKESESAQVLPMMLRRGKVAYLFNKYSRALQIGSVLFCHHNDQKAEATLGDTINDWLGENIGRTPDERAAMLAYTDGISPLFMIATKFNIDLGRTKNDTPADLSTLSTHWQRFDTVIPEIVKPNRWLDEWTVPAPGHPATPFRDIYPLRDFFWSREGRLFTGYSDKGTFSPELEPYRHADFADYTERLRESFMNNDFVRAHFADPAGAWQSFATLNNDGSKPIISNLSRISGVLAEARRAKFMRELETIRDEMMRALKIYYEPDDGTERNRKVRAIAGDIRRSLLSTVASQPVAFGRLLDRFMISPERLRNIAYDILVCHTDSPRDFTEINFERAMAGVDLEAPREENVRRLLDYNMLDTEEELVKIYTDRGFTLDDLLTPGQHALSTMGEVVTKHIIDAWMEHLDDAAREMSKVLPHADEVVFMLATLFDKLQVRRAMAERITRYTELFAQSEQPNTIGDYAALTLNDFVSTVGRRYMKQADIDSFAEKARRCNLPERLIQDAGRADNRRQPVEETLRVLDRAGEIINSGRIDRGLLEQLPFWNNYTRWENALIVGLVMASDVSHADPACNGQVRKLLDESNTLYR